MNFKKSNKAQTKNYFLNKGGQFILKLNAIEKKLIGIQHISQLSYLKEADENWRGGKSNIHT